MFLLKQPVFFFVLKERSGKPFIALEPLLPAVLKFCDQFRNGKCFPPVPEQAVQGQCRTAGDHHLGAFRDDDLVFGELEPLREDTDQHRVEGQGTALEHHRGTDVQPLGQSADALLCDGVEGRERQIAGQDALVQQRLDICLREHAAASGNVKDCCALFSQRVEFLRGHMQNGGHFVDKGAGPSGAAAVHPHVVHLGAAGGLVFPKKEDLRILAAQLNGCSDISAVLTEGDGVCHHLLDKGHTGSIGRGLRAGTCQDQRHLRARELPVKVVQGPDDALSLFRVMPSVICVKQLSGILPEGCDLCCCGTYINTQTDLFTASVHFRRLLIT